jgi:hypothetical protein
MNIKSTKSSTSMAMMAAAVVLMGSVATAQVAGLAPGEPFVAYVGHGPDVPLLVLRVGYVPSAGGQLHILDGSQVQRIAARGLSTFVRTRGEVIRLDGRADLQRRDQGVQKSGLLATKTLSVATAQGSNAGLKAGMDKFKRLHTSRGKIGTKPPATVIIFCPKAPGASNMMSVKTLPVAASQGDEAGLKAGMEKFNRLHTSRKKIAAK